jgi:hypothetical protein
MTKRCTYGHLNDDNAKLCQECSDWDFEPIGAEQGSEPGLAVSAGADTVAAPEGGSAAVLRLDFDGGWSIDLAKGDRVQLGRDPEWSPHAGALASYRYISNRHATVGVRPDGKAWIRDESSMNGTFHNDIRIAAGAPCTLAHGDMVKLSSRLAARVSRPAWASDARESGDRA